MDISYILTKVVIEYPGRNDVVAGDSTPQPAFAQAELTKDVIELPTPHIKGK